MTEGGRRQNPWRFTTAGIEFAAVFGVFVAAGYALDTWVTKFGAVCTVWGAVIGFGCALHRLLKQARQAGHFDDDDFEDPGEDSR